MKMHVSGFSHNRFRPNWAQLKPNACPDILEPMIRHRIMQKIKEKTRPCPNLGLHEMTPKHGLPVTQILARIWQKTKLVTLREGDQIFN